MSNYYFTFGQEHRLSDGYPLRDHWVKVEADDYLSARKIFMDEFATPWLERPLGWAFQYDEAGFKSEYFPKEEYKFIKQQKHNKMAINKVDLTVTQLVNDLNEGYTWLKKDDLGYGSIEVKYGANEKQIAAIRKHPALKDAETTVTIFNIIDDTKNNQKNDTSSPLETKGSSVTRTNAPVEQIPVAMASHGTEVATTEAADIFANL
jgi:hypothetical protein